MSATSGVQADNDRVVVSVASIYAVTEWGREFRSALPESSQDAPREVVDVERVRRGLTKSNVECYMLGLQERRQTRPARKMSVARFAGDSSPTPSAAIGCRQDDASGPPEVRMVVPENSGHTGSTRTVGRQVRGCEYQFQLVFSNAPLIDFDELGSVLRRVEISVGAGICEVLACKVDLMIGAQRIAVPRPRIQPIVVGIVISF